VTPPPWPRLHPQDTPDWPLGPQLLLIAGVVLSVGLAAYALWMRDAITVWREARQQQPVLTQQLNARQAMHTAMASLAPLLGRHSLGCDRESVRKLATSSDLTLLIGDAADETPHGGWVEASMPVLLSGTWNGLKTFSSAISTASNAMVLEIASLARGSNHEIEMQGKIRCIRHVAPPSS